MTRRSSDPRCGLHPDGTHLALPRYSGLSALI